MPAQVEQPGIHIFDANALQSEDVPGRTVVGMEGSMAPGGFMAQLTGDQRPKYIKIPSASMHKHARWLR